MIKKIITTEWLVEVLRAKSAKNRYVALLNIPPEKEVAFVTDLLHSALQHTFTSIEKLPDYDYEVLFARFVDKRELYEAVRVEYDFEEVVTQIPYYCTKSEITKHRDVYSLPSLFDMAAVAFDDLYHEFVEELHTMLNIDKYNRYAKITLLSVDGGSESFLLQAEGDIRNDIFKELFQNGNFNEDDYAAVKEFIKERRYGKDTKDSI